MRGNNKNRKIKILVVIVILFLLLGTSMVTSTSRYALPPSDNENIIIESLTDVVFDHKPCRYSGKTMKHDKRAWEGKEIFIKKWGITPVGIL